jgi:AmmeMemoRadiSam system protein B
MMSARTQIRPPAVAGLFYPRDADTLQRTVDQLLNDVPPISIDGQVLSVIVPHAGYAYSGFTAAHAYASLRNMSYDTVIAVGPSHREYFEGVSVYPGKAYQTPLGDVNIDNELRTELVALGIVSSVAGHRSEHSLEVQIPFLQRIKSSFRFVPLVMGSQSPQLCTQLACVLAEVSRNRRVLLLASTDLSHFHSQHEAHALDTSVTDLVRQFDTAELARRLANESIEACGGGPMVAVMNASRDLGANATHLYHYCTSGDVTGEHNSVVGYLSAAIFRKK